MLITLQEQVTLQTVVKKAWYFWTDFVNLLYFCTCELINVLFLTLNKIWIFLKHPHSPEKPDQKIQRKVNRLTVSPKKPCIPHFEHHKNFPQKMDSKTLMYLLNPNFMQKIEKSNKSILRKHCHRPTDG